MTLILGRGRAVLLALVMSLTLATAGITGLTLVVSAPAQAAGELTVATAVSSQDGSTRTARGYVVGQPTGTSTVVTSGFPNDYALAIADSAGETDTGDMLYVQIPSQHRAAWGLQSNPGLMGERIDVTGVLTAYFSHPGLKSSSAFAYAGGDPTPDPDPTDPGPTDPGSDPGDYYASAAGLSGAALKAELHDIISDQTVLSYSEVWVALRDTDEDPSNPSNVIELYSGTSISKTSNGGSVGDWNREHVWAKSHGDFGTSPGPGTDVHHLRPTDVQVNSTRSNKDFDEGGSGVSGCSGCYTDGDSFEPPDRVKGDVARMIFYMATRYESGDGVDLEVNDSINGSTPFHGRLSALLAWHSQDPPSAFEMRRNDRIFEQWQGNRNPFIDHPEWVDAIWN